ncbi:MAG: cache domain-containing protein [Xanthobacteraceae bacterium]
MVLQKAMIGTLAVFAVTFSLTGFAAAQSGTAAEAKAMLEKAVVAVKADKAKAIDMFNKGEGGFKDRDLYPFCFNLSDGIEVAGPPAVRGKDVRTLKDSTGKSFGEELYKAGQGETISEVSYMFPRLGETTPVAKTSFVAKAGDLGCGVGYYK